MHSGHMKIELDYLPRVTGNERNRIEKVTRSSGFFSSDEVRIAMEVFDDYAEKGTESGYHYIFAKNGNEIAGYACFGPIPCTESSFDLYWIAVDNTLRGQGIGQTLLVASEKIAVEMGATRMYLDTSSRPQYDPTRAFYLAAGYEVAAVIDDFYASGDSKVLFLKKFESPRL